MPDIEIKKKRRKTNGIKSFIWEFHKMLEISWTWNMNEWMNEISFNVCRYLIRFVPIAPTRNLHIHKCIESSIICVRYVIFKCIVLHYYFLVVELTLVCSLIALWLSMHLLNLIICMCLYNTMKSAPHVTIIQPHSRLSSQLSNLTFSHKTWNMEHVLYIQPIQINIRSHESCFTYSLCSFLYNVRLYNRHSLSSNQRHFSIFLFLLEML